MRPLAAAAAAGALAAASAATWGLGVERHLYTVRRHVLPVLPPHSDPLRVLHISDVHMAPWQRDRQRWIARLATLRPHLVVNTGDNLGHAEGLAGLRRAFGPLRGIPGVYVHGSNDYSAPSPRNPLRYFRGPSVHVRAAKPLDADALDAYLTDELGWTPIDNAAATVRAGRLRIDAFGVADAHRRWDRADALPDAIAALGPGANLVLGVTHAPYRRVLDAFCDLGAQAIFGGHTHGGQVRVPFARRAIVANCDIPLDQARGLSAWTHGGRTVPLNVSAGLGHSIYAPIRFGCRPEASLLTLVPADA